VTVFHLGVLEMPYADAGVTTGDVAEILESKYSIMQTFVDTIGQDAIAKALERSVVNAVENVMMGAPTAGLSLTAEGEGEIDEAFRTFLEQQEMDGRVAGVPTAAALAGVNHRLAHPYSKDNPERPSFVDTGTYSASFRAWIED
jgi:hypothetical protein